MKWTFLNTGDTAWPADTVFVQSGGDQLDFETLNGSLSIAPGETLTIAVNFKAFETEGDFTLYLTLSSNQHATYFGEEVSLNLTVRDLGKLLHIDTVHN